ncbi:MAG: hypothetical protein M3P92_04420 [Actinomycetota bacterium]|nr:hypothetical protein [Actinomycetota bacterium]
MNADADRGCALVDVVVTATNRFVGAGAVAAGGDLRDLRRLRLAGCRRPLISGRPARPGATLPTASNCVSPQREKRRLY